MQHSRLQLSTYSIMNYTKSYALKYNMYKCYTIKHNTVQFAMLYCEEEKI